MKIAVLTSSRADFGIYLPLLKKLKKDSYFKLEIIAFGSHLSKNHGYSFTEIEDEKFEKIHKISSLVLNDDENGIATSYGLTILKFADFWKNNKYDLILCLGDRFEMSAAVQAGIPFNLKFGHIHGGETTLGAIDNIYRDQLTIASNLHFTAAYQYSEKVSKICGNTNFVHTVGSLSLDGFLNFKPIEKDLFYKKFNIPFLDFGLVTFHPETVNTNMNQHFASEMRKALLNIASGLFLVITMPNADTMGSIYREQINLLKNEFPEKIMCIENFGKANYFSAMYYCRILIGNTSSGILEAASFKKFVVNVGDRQKGRMQSNNVLNCSFNSNEIIETVMEALSRNSKSIVNKFELENTADLIIGKIKLFHESI